MSAQNLLFGVRAAARVEGWLIFGVWICVSLISMRPRPLPVQMAVAAGCLAGAFFEVLGEGALIRETAGGGDF